MPLFHVPRHRKHLLSVPPFYYPSPRKWQVLRLLFSADLFIIDKIKVSQFVGLYLII